MGRGRAKAKQTKVARDLKYNTGHTDLGALQAELSNSSLSNTSEDDFEDEKYSDDPYAKYYDEDDDSEEESD